MKPLSPILAALLLLGISFSNIARADDPGAPGATTVLKWKDGKKAVFLMMFDDSVVSDVTTVIPELKKRGLTGTFYVVPNSGQYKAHQKEWETELPGPGIVYANHTFNHKGVADAAQLDQELTDCSAAIDKCFPDLKQPRLMSFGQPGGVPWKVTKDEFKAAMTKHNLVDRPPYKGYPATIQTQEAMLALVDHALASGEMDYNVFHGVGGDWLVTPTPIFLALLDKLEANKDQLWITDTLSWDEYAAERKSAEVKVAEAGATRIRIQLTCAEDPALYNLPLTLTTQVPPDWKQCQVTQGSTSTTVTPVAGVVTYSAVPGANEISIQPVPGA